MILTHLDLSTAHVSRATMDLLSRVGVAGDCDTGECSDKRIHALGWPAMTVAAYDKGCFVSVVSEAQPAQWAALPSDLFAVIEYARRHGTTVIRFDADGEELEGLPVFDW